MAIDQITNKAGAFPSKLDRSSQISAKNKTNRISNEQEKVTAGADFGKNYSVTLKDIDTSIIKHITNHIKPTVRESGELIKVPVMYGNEERWNSVRGRGVLRDRNGSIILPVIVIKRTNVNFTDAMPLSFDHDLKGEFIQKQRARVYSPTNRYDRFAVQRGIKPVERILVTGMPDFVDLGYSLVLQTSLISQMNTLQELFLEHLETYFGDSTTYKFLSGLDGGMSDASTYDIGADRVIKTEFSMTVKGYVIPEFTTNMYGTVSETTYQNTKGKLNITFTERT